MEEFIRHVKDENKPATTSNVERFSGTVEPESRNQLSDSTEVMEQEIKHKGEEIKQIFALLIDRHVSDLVRVLQSVNSSTSGTDAMSSLDAMQLALTELESFRTSLLGLKWNGSPGHTTQAAGDVHVRASGLPDKQDISGIHQNPSDKFTELLNTDQLTRDDQNFFGHVATIINPGIYQCTNIYYVVDFCRRQFRMFKVKFGTKEHKNKRHLDR